MWHNEPHKTVGIRITHQFEGCQEENMNFLNEVINQASKKIGSQKELDKYLGLAEGHLTETKAGRRGLPDFAQMRLEEYMGLDNGSLRAASAIITEKDTKIKKIWEKLVKAEAAAYKFMGDQPAKESVKQTAKKVKEIFKTSTKK